MKSTDPKHYMTVQTIVGALTNVVLNGVLAAVTTDHHSGDAASLQTLATVVAPQFFFAAFLSSLSPSLMTRWKYAQGKLLPPLKNGIPSAWRLVILSAMLGVVSALTGIIAVAAALHLFFRDGLTSLTRVLFNAVCGGLISAFAIPIALWLGFSRLPTSRTGSRNKLTPS